MQADTVVEPALFKSTHGALKFAFSIAHASPQNIIDKLMHGATPAGKGLGGLDGCGMAGMIKAEIAAIDPRIRGQIITARFALHGVPCTCHHACCSGETPNPEWMRAIGEISDLVRTGALAGLLVSYLLRRVIVRRYFGERISLREAAEQCRVDRDTASEHASRVITYLRAQEKAGWYDIDGRLHSAGIVGGQ
jgi:hypothetical protein